MNTFSYYITTHFIPSNKDYNSCCNLYSVYQTYPKEQHLNTILKFYPKENIIRRDSNDGCKYNKYYNKFLYYLNILKRG